MVIVIGMRYKVEFTDSHAKQWRHVIVNERELLSGELLDVILQKFCTKVKYVTVYKIELITEES